MEIDEREQNTLELILLGAHLKCILMTMYYSIHKEME
jgi:hypothetical protein